MANGPYRPNGRWEPGGTVPITEGTPANAVSVYYTDSGGNLYYPYSTTTATQNLYMLQQVQQQMQRQYLAYNQLLNQMWLNGTASMQFQLSEEPELETKALTAEDKNEIDKVVPF